MTAVEWLLEGDPAIRWQTLRDVADAPAEVVEGERGRVATEGWGAQLLAQQTAGGIWGSADPNTDWVGSAARTTLHTLGALRDMGLDPRSPEAVAAITRLNDSQEWYAAMPPMFAWEGRPFFAGETEPCINGRVVSVAAYFGQDVDVVVERLLGEQMADGGWNCEQESGSTRGSFNSTINVLEGLLEYERAGGGLGVAEARRRGEEYLLERRLMRRLSTGEVVAPYVPHLRYPSGWMYDVLRGLEYFRAVGGDPDPRVQEAVAHVASRQRADRTWVLDWTQGEDEVLDMGERVDQPSRWITLKALRVLRWAGA